MLSLCALNRGRYFYAAMLQEFGQKFRRIALLFTFSSHRQKAFRSVSLGFQG
jgi:hypothetical protein